nr:glycosyltransferase [Baekduia sp.]
MPSVDVLIVSFNTRELLRDCLTSVYAHPPREGIELHVSVFDNASTDGSPEMVAESFPAVRLVRSEDNLGFGAGNDRVAETSDADLLLLLNSDTILTEDVISPLADELLASEQIAIAAPRLEFPDGELQLSSLSFPT